VDQNPEAPARDWHFLLYVAGMTPNAEATHRRLEALVARHVGPEAVVAIVDLSQEPARARRDGIVAIPTVIRTRPAPTHTVIGDLTDTARALQGLGIPEAPPRA